MNRTGNTTTTGGHAPPHQMVDMMSNLKINSEKLNDAVSELKKSMRYCTEVSVIAGQLDGVVFRLVANKSDDDDIFRDDEETESRFIFLSKQQ